MDSALFAGATRLTLGAERRCRSRPQRAAPHGWPAVASVKRKEIWIPSRARPRTCLSCTEGMGGSRPPPPVASTSARLDSPVTANSDTLRTVVSQRPNISRAAVAGQRRLRCHRRHPRRCGYRSEGPQRRLAVATFTGRPNLIEHDKSTNDPTSGPLSPRGPIIVFPGSSQ